MAAMAASIFQELTENKKVCVFSTKFGSVLVDMVFNLLATAAFSARSDLLFSPSVVFSITFVDGSIVRPTLVLSAFACASGLSAISGFTAVLAELESVISEPSSSFLPVA